MLRRGNGRSWRACVEHDGDQLDGDQRDGDQRDGDQLDGDQLDGDDVHRDGERVRRRDERNRRPVRGADLLNDPTNCGACGHDCLGAACQGAMCQPIPLAINQGGTRAIALDTTNVYWTSGYSGVTGYVYTVAKEGGVAVQLYSSQYGTSGIADDATTVFTTSNGEIMAIPKGGGSANQLAVGGTWGGAIATDGTSVYWGDSSGAGINKIVLATNMLTKLAAAPEPQFLTLDATNGYWTDDMTGSVMKVPLTGGVAVTLATSPSPSGIAVDATTARPGYWD